MRKEQKIVAVGAASGVVSTLALVALLYKLLPVINGNAQGFALASIALSVVPLFIMVVTIGNARFLGKAIDPTKHAEDHAMEIDGRVVDNTLQQNFIFVVGALALAAQLPFQQQKLILALSITFVIARFVFWYGYRRNPLLRAPGMAATGYLNLLVFLTVLYYVVH
jgi:uncharacterized membrane protein YecN with MAPEG domain